MEETAAFTLNIAPESILNDCALHFLERLEVLDLSQNTEVIIKTIQDLVQLWFLDPELQHSLPLFGSNSQIDKLFR